MPDTPSLPPAGPRWPGQTWTGLLPMLADRTSALSEAAQRPGLPATDPLSRAGSPARSSYWSWPEAYPPSLQPAPRAMARGVLNLNESNAMTKNIGNLDRALRIVAGVALIALAALGHIGPWGWIGVVPLGTALLGWCPAYALLGLKT
jgi:hypothetical protein